jgi:hypothetical protein
MYRVQFRHIKEGLGLYTYIFGKAITLFLSILRHLKIQKPTSQQGRKTNKRK